MSVLDICSEFLSFSSKLKFHTSGVNDLPWTHPKLPFVELFKLIVMASNKNELSLAVVTERVRIVRILIKGKSVSVFLNQQGIDTPTIISKV